MKLSSNVLQDAESCAAAIKSIAAQRKTLGTREIFFGTGYILADSRQVYSNDHVTVIKSNKISNPATEEPRTFNGSDVELYYVSLNEGNKTPAQIEEQKQAEANGIDIRLVRGKFLDAGFNKNGKAMMKVTNVNRKTADGLPSYRTISLETGIVIAIAFNRSLGLNPDKLKAMGDKVLAKALAEQNSIAARLKKIATPQLMSDAQEADIPPAAMEQDQAQVDKPLTFRCKRRR